MVEIIKGMQPTSNNNFLVFLFMTLGLPSKMVLSRSLVQGTSIPKQNMVSERNLLKLQITRSAMGGESSVMEHCSRVLPPDDATASPFSGSNLSRWYCLVLLLRSIYKLADNSVNQYNHLVWSTRTTIAPAVGFNYPHNSPTGKLLP